ncbi:hypothetical protein J8273_5545 [Carpediemonas membranifera]|uniref:Uncharacterized protein n=1 Tax=Carpediemonas membranifera TaxID=201153 RepID=A0A8J6AU51_9EUKA|nr:hypothetical protein J8273_5545 [Carpediemonas membranifera]|eukprot:KAG9392540.1 hypothetical protein J8273_5545 [Carpediemonas membranifera]
MARDKLSKEGKSIEEIYSVTLEVKDRELREMDRNLKQITASSMKLIDAVTEMLETSAGKALPSKSTLEAHLNELRLSLNPPAVGTALPSVHSGQEPDRNYRALYLKERNEVRKLQHQLSKLRRAPPTIVDEITAFETQEEYQLNLSLGRSPPAGMSASPFTGTAIPSPSPDTLVGSPCLIEPLMDHRAEAHAGRGHAHGHVYGMPSWGMGPMSLPSGHIPHHGPKSVDLGHHLFDS